MEASEGSVCSFIRKPTKTTKNIRKRRTIEEHEENDSPADDDESSFLKTNNSSRRKSSTHENNSLYFSTPAGSGRNNFQFESSKNVPVQDDGGETEPLEPEFSGDERAVRERALKQAKEDLMMKGGGGAEKLYGGIRGYRDHKAGFRREQRIGKEKAGGPHGPLRASEHIRVAPRFDYQPDVCKDYKETGYCGYGDSCKFMHDRGDYKNGWQLEKEWEEAEKKARKRILGLGKLDDDDDDDNEEEEEGDSLPFACSICRQPFQDPVVTKCKHYFCGHCALKHHEKKKKCFVCNQPTLGNFNTALELRKRMVEQGKQ